VVNYEKFRDYLNPKCLPIWILMAFQAGYLNAGGFIACHRFVSHVTGFGTQAGISLSTNEYLFAFEMALAPLSFIVGAAAAAMLIDKELLKKKDPHVKSALLIMTGIATAVWIIGEFGFFGEFGEPLRLQRDFMLLFSLCFLCGFQNALFVTLSSGSIRTTHLTGIATDIGINFVRAHYTVKDQKTFIIKQNWLRVGTFLSFTIGSMIATLVFPFTQYHGFFVPAILSFLTFLYIYFNFGREVLSGKNLSETH
jgi:uncharacterized membrane protein YoaK (UPF0700 family)